MMFCLSPPLLCGFIAHLPLVFHLPPGFEVKQSLRYIFSPYPQPEFLCLKTQALSDFLPPLFASSSSSMSLWVEIRLVIIVV